MKIFQKILRTLFVMVMLAAPTGSALAKGAGTDGPADFDRAALIQAAIDNQVYSYAPYSSSMFPRQFLRTPAGFIWALMSKTLPSRWEFAPSTTL